jgi:sulfatase maturation enzyme AslB (radical SAM superfamily)
MNKVEIPKEFNYISAFLTFRCNLRCKYCLNTFEKDFSRKREELSGEQWINALNRLETEIPITFSGGEPFVHRDFVEIIKNLKPELGIDILTNLYSSSKDYKKTLERFIKEINPERINRNVPYHNIRVSYHSEQMTNPELLIENIKKLQNRSFRVGVYAVNSPYPQDAARITQMQFLCLNEGVDFRIKDFVGLFEEGDRFGRPFSVLYGDYSKYPDSIFQEKTKEVVCRTPELLIGPNGDVYKCHRDLYSQESPIGNIISPDFMAEYKFRKCDKYGNCHPCDVKGKTSHKQEIGYTAVTIRNKE